MAGARCSPTGRSCTASRAATAAAHVGFVATGRAIDAEFAENISLAMLTVLETLGPAERAVFVLREVFETPYDEIAEAVDKTPAAGRHAAAATG